MMIGTVRRIDSESYELVGQIFSAQRGVNVADARTMFVGTLVAAAAAPWPPAPVQPAPPVFVPAPEPQHEETPSAPEVMTTEVGQFLIELHGCHRKNTSVECALVMNNQGNNVGFVIHYHGTLLFDPENRPQTFVRSYTYQQAADLQHTDARKHPVCECATRRSSDLIPSAAPRGSRQRQGGVSLRPDPRGVAVVDIQRIQRCWLADGASDL